MISSGTNLILPQSRKCLKIWQPPSGETFAFVDSLFLPPLLVCLDCKQESLWNYKEPLSWWKQSGVLLCRVWMYISSQAVLFLPVSSNNLLRNHENWLRCSPSHFTHEIWLYLFSLSHLFIPSNWKVSVEESSGENRLAVNNIVCSKSTPFSYLLFILYH